MKNFKRALNYLFIFIIPLMFFIGILNTSNVFKENKLLSSESNNKGDKSNGDMPDNYLNFIATP